MYADTYRQKLVEQIFNPSNFTSMKIDGKRSLISKVVSRVRIEISMDVIRQYGQYIMHINV